MKSFLLFVLELARDLPFGLRLPSSTKHVATHTQQISMHPNPATQFIHFSNTYVKLEGVTYELYSLMGQSIPNGTCRQTGTYLRIVHTREGVTAKKLSFNTKPHLP